jgi:hypothetical protein
LGEETGQRVYATALQSVGFFGSHLCVILLYVTPPVRGKVKEGNEGRDRLRRGKGERKKKGRRMGLEHLKGEGGYID